MHAGGKFSGGAYGISGRLHGVGPQWLTRFRGHAGYGKTGQQNLSDRFERGEATEPLEVIGETDPADTSTKLNFGRPEIFDEVEFDFDIMLKRYREMAFLNKEIIITLIDERDRKISSAKITL